MRAKHLPPVLLLSVAIFSMAPSARPAAPQKKEYLSDAEADKIRDAGTSGPRIKLFTMFAADRIKKLINSYSGCIDDAADLIELGIQKQEDIREGVKELQARIKEFLPYLQGLAASGPERETYKENLDDAIEATRDAAKDVEKAAKEMAPPPVRRKPS
jgi:hypothetical protein